MNQGINITNDDIRGSHVLFAYESDEEQIRMLAEYLKDGLANNELCVYVTPSSKKQIIKELKAAGLNVQSAVDDGRVRIYDMNETYLPDGTFSRDYMLDNVSKFLGDAASEGYNGLRTAGTMTWLYDHPEYADEADHYEHLVNDLKVKHPDFTGLCLYPVRRGSSKVIDKAMHSHPSIIYNSTV